MAEESAAQSPTVDDVAKAMSEIDRVGLLKILQLPWQFPLVKDFEGLHPVSLFAKSVLKIKVWHVPFLNRGACGECCQGAYLARWGHKTVALKCYSTDLTTGSAVCDHCEQLWALPNDDEEYVLQESMDAAWERYKKGGRKALRNLECMSGLEEFYSGEIQKVKDAVRGSQQDVAVT